MPGSSSQLTEMELTNPLESSLSTLKGVETISSNTTTGSTDITIVLDKWTNPDLFRFEASALLRQLYPRLPKGASYPIISINRQQTENESGESILEYTLSGPATINEVASEAEKTIRPVITKIKGIYRFNIIGGRTEHLVLSEKEEIMKSIGLSHSELGNTLSNALAATDMGLVVTREGNFNITIASSIENKKELMKFPVANKNGRIFTLSDVSTINHEEVPPTSYYRINGDNLISMSFYFEKKVNTIRLAEEVVRIMQDVSKKLPTGYKLTLSHNSTDRIKDELRKIYLRTFLSVSILLFFMFLITRKARYMVIIIASILVNILVSFIFYYLFKLEIHLYSLAGITISLGLVIDNVIVIVEDIRHTGRNRIFVAILASTLTSLGALSVIFFLNDLEKVNLIDFALAIIINLLVSLPIAYFFIPALLEKLPIQLKKNQVSRKRKTNLIMFNRFYYHRLKFLIRYRLYVFLFFGFLFGLPAFLLPAKISEKIPGAAVYNYTIGSEFYQKKISKTVNKYVGGVLYLYINKNNQPFRSEEEEQNRTRLSITISMPKGSTLTQMDKITQSFEQYLKKYNQQIEIFTSNVSSPTKANIEISFKKTYDTEFPVLLKQLLEAKAVYSGSADFSIYGVGRGFNNAIDREEFDSTISLMGYNYSQLQRIAIQISDTLKINPRVNNIMISTSERWRQKPYFEYMLRLNKTNYLALKRIGYWNLSRALQEKQNDQTLLGSILLGNDNYIPVTLVDHKNNIPTLWETNHAPTVINDSTFLRLNNISKTEKVRIGENIVRKNQSYLLNIHYQFIGSGELNQLVKDAIIKSTKRILPFGYKAFDNENNFWDRKGNDYLWFIPLVLLIIFIICTILLESFKQAFAITLMIPFSFIGVFSLFYILGLKFDQGGYAALLMLAGLVTNAALYILNDLNFLARKQSYTTYNTVKLFIRALNAKAMPILVTTASAILSLLPFMIAGEEKGFWFTLSAGTIGGLLFSIIGVYIVLPLCLVPKKRTFINYD